MVSASKVNNFEYALSLRNQIEAIKTLEEKQFAEVSKRVDAHVINYKIFGGKFICFYLILGRVWLKKNKNLFLKRKKIFGRVFVKIL